VIPVELRAAYAATTFRATTPQGEIEIRIGKIHPELDRIVVGAGYRNWGFVTASNPASRQVGHAENTRRHAALCNDVIELALPFFDGDGVPDAGNWQPESSLLIIGIARSKAVELGEKYGQYAVVCGTMGAAAELIECTGANVCA
jgi:hypothetical protein